MYMAYFEPRIYRAVNAGHLRFDIMKFCCIYEQMITKLKLVTWVKPYEKHVGILF